MMASKIYGGPENCSLSKYISIYAKKGDKEEDKDGKRAKRKRSQGQSR